MMNLLYLENLSDDEYHKLCVQHGTQAKLWRQKFAVLLPGVLQRGLHKKKGFGSLNEYAAKLGGLTHEQVSLVLELDRRFKPLPILHQLFLSGEVSFYKMQRVVTVATEENQEWLAGRVQQLPEGVLRTLVRDMKRVDYETISQDHQILGAQNLPISKESGEKINGVRMTEQVARVWVDMDRRGLDVNELFLQFLLQRERDFKDKGELEVMYSEKRALERWLKTQLDGPIITRHIPAAIMRILEGMWGKNCAVFSCGRLWGQVHHTIPFSVMRKHDPKFMLPLCKSHHQIVHSVDDSVLSCRYNAGNGKYGD